jgi:hypothetical protein
MGMMTYKEVDRRLKAGRLPSEISLIAWQRELRVLTNLTKKQSEYWGIRCKIADSYRVCALCSEYEKCAQCPLTKIDECSCHDASSLFRAVCRATTVDDRIAATEDMINVLKKCVEYERTLKTNSELIKVDDITRSS